MSQIERIILGGEDLFLRAGIKSVTMDDIAKHLGMSKKTIYQSFKDKNELVIALVKKKLQEKGIPAGAHITHQDAGKHQGKALPQHHR